MISPIVEYRDVLKEVKKIICSSLSGRVLFSVSSYATKLTNLVGCNIFDEGSSKDRIPPNCVGIATKVENGLNGIPLKKQVFGTIFNLNDSLIFRYHKGKVYLCLDTSQGKFANHTEAIYYIALRYLNSNLLPRYFATYPIKDCFKKEELNSEVIKYLDNMNALAEPAYEYNKSTYTEIMDIRENDANRILKEIDKEFRDGLNRYNNWEDKKKFILFIITLIDMDPYKYDALKPIPFEKCYIDLANTIYNELESSKLLISSNVKDILNKKSLYLRDNLLPLFVISDGPKPKKNSQSDSPYSIKYQIFNCSLSMVRYTTGHVEKSADGYKELLENCDRIFSGNTGTYCVTDILKVI